MLTFCRAVIQWTHESVVFFSAMISSIWGNFLKGKVKCTNIHMQWNEWAGTVRQPLFGILLEADCRRWLQVAVTWITKVVDICTWHMWVCGCTVFPSTVILYFFFNNLCLEWTDILQCECVCECVGVMACIKIKCQVWKHRVHTQKQRKTHTHSRVDFMWRKTHLHHLHSMWPAGRYEIFLF